MKLAVPESVTRGLASMALKTRKNSPHILFGAGVIGIVGSTILACRATLKLEETLDEIRQDVDAANHSAETDPGYTDSEHKKELVSVGAKGVIAVAKLYAPAVIVGTVSVALITKSHIQLSQRNAALTTSLAASMKSFEDYRARVREKIGEKEEEYLYRDIQTVETEDENGKKSKELAISKHGMSQFAVCFDESNRLWKPDPELNKILIMAQQQYMNHKLNAYGYVFLNEVLESLGFERTPIGQIVGWVKNSRIGDNYIDFGIFEGRNREFMHALEPNIWLDFNVQGPILDEMP